MYGLFWRPFERVPHTPASHLPKQLVSEPSTEPKNSNSVEPFFVSVL